MIGKFFAPLAIKIFAGVSLALLVTVGVLGFQLNRANDKIDTLKLEKRTLTAERDRFRDALGFFVKDGQLRIDRGQQALKENEPVSAELRRQANRIRTVTITGDDCETPVEVLEARGL